MVPTSITQAARALRRMAMALGLGAAAASLTGCGAFFVCQKASCPSSSTTTGSGDYVYVSNSTSGSTYVNAYEVGTGKLTAVSGQPFNLGYIPVAMAVSPNDSFLYVLAAPGSTNSGLYMYPISSSTGAISSGTELESGDFGTMAISADGEFLYTLDSASGTVLTQFALNTSTGAVSGVATYGTPGGPAGVGCPISSATPASSLCAVATSPSENYVAVALGTNGTVLFPYTSGSGISGAGYTAAISSPSSSSGDYSLAFDKSNNLYIARTLQISPYAIASSTSLSAGTSRTYSSGMVPRSVTLSTGYGYLYTADEGSSQISAYSVSSGALTALSGSPVSGPTYVSALAAERSGDYLLAAGYGASGGLSMYTITTSGLSSAVATEATATTTTIPVVMAVTH